jgi:integrase/recombinase XerD
MSKRARGRPNGSGGPAAVLTRAQVSEVLRAARSSGRHKDRTELAFILWIEFGLTAGPLAALKIGELIGCDGRVREELKLQFRTTTKSFPLSSPILRRTLANYCDRHLTGAAADAPAFVSQRGGALTRASLARLLTSLYRRAGIVGGSSRSGRKTKSHRLRDNDLTPRTSS